MPKGHQWCGGGAHGRIRERRKEARAAPTFFIPGEEARSTLLQRLFSAYPGGRPGTGLLLLRVVVGGALLVQGRSYLVQPNASPVAWLIGASAIGSSLFLIGGLLTAFAGGLAALGMIGAALGVIPDWTSPLFETKLSVILAATALTAISLLGPGAFSVDARLFGRREVILRPASTHPRDD